MGASKGGRPPKPTALKIVEGNPGKRALNKNEPNPEPGLPKCPTHIPSVAKSLWRELAPQLVAMGVLTLADRRALEIVCTTYAEYREADDDVKKTGLHIQQRAQAAIKLLSQILLLLCGQMPQSVI